MERIFEKSFQKLDRVPLKFSRYLLHELDGKNRLIGIKGARGTGKTTLLLQYARLNLPLDSRTLYVSLDDLFFAENRLVDFAEQFVKHGGQYLLLDEVHRYANWSAELKNIYDDFPDLQVIFTGSSVLHINQAKGDLSRRVVMYELEGFSYREYLNARYGYSLPVLSWEELVNHHTEFARSVTKELRPLAYFDNYLKNGYYPFFLENEEVYGQKLFETIDMAITTDLVAAFEINPGSMEKLKKLLYVVAESVPFQPNISKLSTHTGVTRNTLIRFLEYLEDLRIIKRLYSAAHGISVLQKPDKLLLYHPNLHYALAYGLPEEGSIRESFFVNQVSRHQYVRFAKSGDYQIGDYVFEVGGKNKQRKQVQGIKNAFVVADDLEIGTGQKIPLWVFGFLY